MINLLSVALLLLLISILFVLIKFKDAQGRKALVIAALLILILLYNEYFLVYG